MPMRRVILLACLMCMVSGAGLAQSQSDAGREGAALGEEMLEQARDQVEQTGHDPEGGVRASGSLQIEGVGEIDVNDLLPGADRDAVDQLGDYRIPSSGVSPEAATAMQNAARQQGADGDAARILWGTQQRVAEPDIDAAGWLESSGRAYEQARAGGIEGIFADCRTTTEVRTGSPLITTQTTTHTCSTGERPAACGRTLEVEVTRGATTPVVMAEGVAAAEASELVAFVAAVDVSDPDRLPVGWSVRTGGRVFDARLVDLPTVENGWQGTVSSGVADPACASGGCSANATKWYVEAMIPGPLVVDHEVLAQGACEAEARAQQCTVRWQCADDAPRTINGVRVDDAFAERHGIGSLAPGLGGGLCWKAQAQVTCPICAIDEGGRRNCTNANVSAGTGDTCAAYEARPQCRQTGTQCLIANADGTCLSSSQTWSCDEQVTTSPTETVHTASTCDATLQCLGDGCRDAGEIAGEESGDSLQRAAAAMAVVQTVREDWQSGATPGSSGGGGGGGDESHRDDTLIVDFEPARVGRQSVSGGSTGGDDSLGADWGYDDEDVRERERGEELDLDSSSYPDLSGHVQLFRGTAFKCKKGWGGLVECCSKTRTDAEKRYWRLYQANARRKQGQQMLAEDGAEEGGYQSMGSGGLADLQSSLTSGRDNVTGGQGEGDFQGDASDTHGAFMTEARSEVKPNLSPSWLCSDGEFDLAVQREVGMCSYAGTYCSTKILGTCLQRKEAYCCYSSPMSRMLRASVDGGNIPHGSAKKPDCSGIPVERLDEIDWDSIPFDELVARMDVGQALPSAAERDQAMARYTGAGMAAGGGARPDATERVQSTVDAVEGARVRAGIEADARRYLPAGTSVVDPGVARISFSPAYVSLQAGRRNQVLVARQGGTGTVTATVELVDGDAQSLGFYREQLTWAAGDLGDKPLVFEVAPDAAGATFAVAIVAVAGGEPGASPRLTAVVRER